MNYSVTFDNGPGTNEVNMPTGATALPLWYDETAEGGPQAAAIAVTGELPSLWPLLRYLGRRVRILNRDAFPVWWGKVCEVRIALGVGLQVGLSLDNMVNRVAVRYEIRNDAGVILRTNTAYAEDADSILTYGTKEQLARLRQVSSTQAEAHRDALLTDLAFPLPAYKPSDVNTPPATLLCRGYMDTLDWINYRQPNGLIANDFDRTGALGGDQQILGQGLTASTIGFAASGRISDLTGRMSSFARGSRIRVTGSTSNNGSYTVDSGATKTARSYTATTISFDPTDDIHDSAERLNFLDRDDYMTVTGSASNNGTYRIKSVGGEHCTLAPSSIVTEAAGASVTVARGNALTVASALTAEAPGSSVTITTVGQKIAQKWTQIGTWNAGEIEIRVKRINGSGILSSDELQCAIHADSAGAVGSLLGSGTISMSDIPLYMDWQTVSLSSSVALADGTAYWLVISHTGADDYQDYFVIDLDGDLSYSGGALKLWDGASWVDRAPDADLMFRIKGTQETTAQITDLVTVAGQFLEGVDLVDASGVDSWQYRDGTTTAKDELLALLRSGTSNGRRLLARVTDELYLRVWEQPDRGTVEPKIIFGPDRQLYNRVGSPLAHGRLCAGQWVDLADVPPTVGHTNRITPVFVERAIMNCRDDLVTIVPTGADAAVNFGRISDFDRRI
jgi:hypothetical protein